MGRIIDPDEIKKQAESIVTALTAQNDVLTDVLPHIEEFETTLNLQSKSWEALKSKIGGHKILINALKSTHDMVKTDSETLKSAVGFEKLDEDKINEEIKQLKQDNWGNSWMINSYQSSKSNPIIMLIPSLRDYYTEQINNLRSSIDTNNAAINKLKEKLDKITEIVTATDDLYETAEAYYLTTQQGIDELTKGWNPAGRPIGVSGYWQQLLSSPEEMKAVAALLEAGFTQKEIDHMNQLGYTPTEIYYEWSSLETPEDKEFYQLMVYGTKEDFEEAFKIDPDLLTEAPFIAMVNYIQRQITLDGEEAADNIKNLLNGLLSQRGSLQQSTKYDSTYGQRIDTAKRRVDTYLIRLSQQGNLMANQLGLILLYDDENEDLVNAYDKMRVLDNLFETFYIANPVYTKSGRENIQQHFYGEIESLTFPNVKEEGVTDSVRFSLQTYSAYLDFAEGMEGSFNEYKTNRLAEWEKYSGENIDKNLQEFRKEKENYWQKIVGDGAILAAGIWQPWLGATLGLAASMGDLSSTAKNGTKTTKELDSILTKQRKEALRASDYSDQEIKQRIDQLDKNARVRSVTLDGMAAVIGWYADWHKLSQEERTEKQNKLNSLLDVGGLSIKEDDTIIQLAPSLYNDLHYEDQSRLADLLENGYQSYFDTFGNKKKDIIEGLKNMKQEDENKDKIGTIDFMLNGGDPLSDEVQLDQIRGIMAEVAKNPDLKLDPETIYYDINNFFKRDYYPKWEEPKMGGTR